MIAMYTTVVLEAAVLDRPLLAAAFDGYNKLPFHRSIRRFEQFEHFQDVLKTGALPTAYDFKQLDILIGNYMKNPSLFSQERQRLREELCFPLDGQASERIFKKIID
jgi:CDP-glycerol glycerophosphotransferase (TagB/SpsB family)